MDGELRAILTSVSNTLQEISGKNPYLVDSSVTGKSFQQIVVQADGTTITVATGGPSGATNYLTIWNISGKTLNKGAILRAAHNLPITALTVTAGQVIGYE